MEENSEERERGVLGKSPLRTLFFPQYRRRAFAQRALKTRERERERERERKKERETRAIEREEEKE